LRNKSYTNLGGILADGDSMNRDPTNDTYSVIRGFSGAYPNFFLAVDYEDLETFLGYFGAITSLEQYQEFIARYGIRRTNHKFWDYSDWFHEKYAEEQPLEYGVFDLNRYGNY
jgi:hypothetical protein